MKLIKKESKKTIKHYDAISNQMASFSENQKLALQNQEEQQKEIQNLKKEVAYLRVQTIKVLIISGYSKSEVEDANLKLFVIEIAKFLNVSMTETDIRSTKLLKQQQNNTVSNTQSIQNTNSKTASIVVEFYSSSHCIKILDAKKIAKKNH